MTTDPETGSPQIAPPQTAALQTAVPSPTRCGLIALAGVPNAGKSTLLNAVVGQKISIVSPKVQTTRHRIAGIVTEGAAQLVFLDVPGLLPRTKQALEAAMVATAWEAISEADVVVYLLDATTADKAAHAEILARLVQQRRPLVLAVNKVDLVPREQLLPLLDRLRQAAPFEEYFLISARTGSGLDTFRRTLARHVPEGPWLYDADALTDRPLRFLAAELTREKLFLALRQELPYGLKVETERWENIRRGGAKVHQLITVSREGHKKIILGQKGELLKRIGMQVRQDLSTQTGGPVHLFLHVKVVPDWQGRGDALAV
jgi:GTPase